MRRSLGQEVAFFQRCARCGLHRSSSCLTKACHVINADGQIVVGKPGDEVLIASGKLNSELAGLAMDVENVGEVWIKPLNQRTISGGRKMWVFEMKQVGMQKRTFNLRLTSGNVITPESRRLAAAAADADPEWMQD